VLEVAANDKGEAMTSALAAVAGDIGVDVDVHELDAAVL